MGVRSARGLRFAAFAFAVGGAQCGKLESQELPRVHPSGIEDAGIADASTPSNDCPTSRTLIELGASCSWTGTCSVSLDVCGTGVGITLATRCVSGIVESPKGIMPTCSLPEAGDAVTPPMQHCPSHITAGASCQFVGTCTVPYCSPAQSLLCTCEQGEWDCPGAADCAPGPECTIGAQCLAPETTCVIAGGGPCGSDTRLICTPAMKYGSYDSLCDQHATGCTSTSTGGDGGSECTQACICEDGVMACSVCPDAGAP